MRTLPQVRGRRGVRRLRPPDAAGRRGETSDQARQLLSLRNPPRFPLPWELRQRLPQRAPQDRRHLLHPQCISHFSPPLLHSSLISLLSILLRFSSQC
jgi:hypothetical protein